MLRQAETTKALINRFVLHYQIVSNGIPRFFSDSTFLMDAKGREYALDLLKDRNQVYLYIRETDCWDCVKFIVNELKYRSKRQFVVIGQYSTFSVFESYMNRLNLSGQSNIYYCKEGLFKEDYLDYLETPMFFSIKDEKTAEVEFIPYKYLKDVQDLYLNN